jgi:hypothetical protein
VCTNGGARYDSGITTSSTNDASQAGANAMTRELCRWLAAAMLMLLCPMAMAQIYTCTAPDGSRIFSDKRCGPDAKVVKGIETQPKKPASAAKATAPTSRSPAELESLLKMCNAGDDAACMSWSKGGGPAQLKEKEKQQESSCEGGSIEACERRYCRDGATEDCRQHVLGLATLSGETWYLRYQRKAASDAPTVYSIRCLLPGSRELRDTAITCAAVAGPQRCQADDSTQGFPRLSDAATAFCAVAR